MYAHLHVCMDVCRHGDTEDLDMCVCVYMQNACACMSHKCNSLYLYIYIYAHTQYTCICVVEKWCIVPKYKQKQRDWGGAAPHPSTACCQMRSRYEAYRKLHSWIFAEVPWCSILGERQGTSKTEWKTRRKEEKETKRWRTNDRMKMRRQEREDDRDGRMNMNYDM